MKHTQGKWEAVEAFIENSDNHLIVKQEGWGGKNIADCGIMIDENSANARLIASAPELLEALELILGSINYDLDKIAYSRIEDVVDKARGL
jgi:hypothetical protein